MTIKHIDSSVEQWEMDLSYIGDWPGCLIMIINLLQMVMWFIIGCRWDWNSEF
jgi:hypothetical protein